MATAQTEAERVKEDILGLRASTSTVTVLQKLVAGNQARPHPSSTRRVKINANRTKSANEVNVAEDATETPSIKQRCSIATEIVNITLKVLTESARARRPGAVPDFASNGAPRDAVTNSGEARRQILSPRSANSTPSKSSSVRAKSPSKRPVPVEAIEEIGHVETTAVCARTAFAFLRSREAVKVNTKNARSLQLESGMLALVAKLLANDLVDLAVKELRLVKQDLETFCSVPKTDAPSKETLAGLLILHNAIRLQQEALSLAVTYQALVLRVLGAVRKPRSIEACVELLDAQCPASPSNLIMTLHDSARDAPRTARALSTLSSAILALCPSASSKTDEQANDASTQPTPEAVLRLQVIALNVQRLEWSLSNEHGTDRDFLEPLTRCVAAYVRRTSGTRCVRVVHRTVKEVLRTCDNSNLQRVAALPLLRTLHSLAEDAQCSEACIHWAEQIWGAVSSLEDGHARKLAASTRLARLQSKHSFVAAAAGCIEVALRGKISGGTADYDELLAELAQLCKRMCSDIPAGPNIQTPIHALLTTCATFAQRCFRTWPDKSIRHVQSILGTALRHMPSSEDVARWVTRDAATVFCDGDTIEALTRAASTQSSERAWAHSSHTLGLARVLRVLVLQAMRSSWKAIADAIYDSKALTDSGRSLVLQCQMKAVIDYASRPKYQDSATALLRELLRRLLAIWTPTEYPVRHLAISCMLWRFHDAHPGVLTAVDVEPWCRDNTVPDDLTNDTGLRGYLVGLGTELEIARLMRSGIASVKALSEVIAPFERLVGNAEDLTTLQACFWDICSVRSIVSALACCFAARGAGATTIRILQLLYRLDCMVDASTHMLDSGLRLASTWIHLGSVERADEMLERVAPLATVGACSTLQSIQYRLMAADCSLAADKHDECQTHLTEIAELRKELPPNKVPREQRLVYEQTHAEGWMAQAAWSSATGAPHDALADMKHAVKILNSIWHRLEKSDGAEMQVTKSSAAEDDDRIVDLVSGVSKLQLIPKDQTAASTQTKGAPFWPLVPVLSKALMRLSDLYVHHGLFSEASFYSSKAIEVASALGPSPLLSRVRSHRALLLTAAGDVEGAELCLAADENFDASENPLVAIVRHQAKAAILTKEKSFERAIKVYDEAERIVQRLINSNVSAQALLPEGVTTHYEAGRSNVSPSGSANPTQETVTKPPRVPRANARKTTAVVGREPRVASSKVTATIRPHVVPTLETPKVYPLSKLLFDITHARTQVLLNLADGIDHSSAGLGSPPGDIARRHRSTRLQARQHLARVTRDLQTDITYNILPEAALALPALLPAKLSSKPAAKSAATNPVSSRTKRPVASPDTGNNAFVAPLQEALRCLRIEDPRFAQCTSTAEHHSDGSLHRGAIMPLSALTNTSRSTADLQPSMLTAVDQARCIGTEREAAAIAVDLRHDAKCSPFEWPEAPRNVVDSAVLGADFQANYIDILPEPWTAVSLTLDEDCTELLVARYRRGQTPVFLRLPFARHKPEESGEDQFDYHMAKSEIREIIQRSNASCHNNSDVSSKSAKSSWWTERETLDRRLQELLLNMEEIWLGGFRGILSTMTQEASELVRFRKDIVAILNRHLPSRQTVRGKAVNLELDDSVLALFVSLGQGRDDASEIDELVTDLLYFVTDLLQLSGERNAYDEIDFDSMTVETLDALRSRGSHDGSSSEDQHLILVLDKRLQAFPWENLPCLQDTSVSRVNSMLTLRNCILAMREAATDSPDRHTVKRTNGSYILNPSLELVNTQATLEPALRKAAARENAQWSSIVKRAPSEDEFKTLLQTSSMMLYFGHGAGSQYIRPRTIAKLEKCSEIVWLMGCSSGAVTEHGELEPQAVPLSYLMAGTKSSGATVNETGNSTVSNGKCFAVLATLWDVTDKDIDRFSLAVGEEWGLFEASPEPSRLPAKTPRKRDRMLAPLTPQQVPKTPKTPKVKKTPAIVATPSTSTSRARGKTGQSVSLVEVVSKSRDACYLRYLNGAAPVVYGVPVYLGE